MLKKVKKTHAIVMKNKKRHARKNGSHKSEHETCESEMCTK